MRSNQHVGMHSAAEEDYEVDLNAVSNRELEEKIRKMKEKIQKAQVLQDDESENENQQRDDESYGREEGDEGDFEVGHDHQHQEESYYQEGNHEENEYDNNSRNEYEEQNESRGRFEDDESHEIAGKGQKPGNQVLDFDEEEDVEQVEATGKPIQKEDLKEKINKMKQAIAALAINQEQKPGDETEDGDFEDSRQIKSNQNRGGNRVDTIEADDEDVDNSYEAYNDHQHQLSKNYPPSQSRRGTYQKNNTNSDLSSYRGGGGKSQKSFKPKHKFNQGTLNYDNLTSGRGQVNDDEEASYVEDKNPIVEDRSTKNQQQQRGTWKSGVSVINTQDMSKLSKQNKHSQKLQSITQENSKRRTDITGNRQRKQSKFEDDEDKFESQGEEDRDKDQEESRSDRDEDSNYDHDDQDQDDEDDEDEEEDDDEEEEEEDDIPLESDIDDKSGYTSKSKIQKKNKSQSKRNKSPPNPALTLMPDPNTVFSLGAQLPTPPIFGMNPTDPSAWSPAAAGLNTLGFSPFGINPTAPSPLMFPSNPLMMQPPPPNLTNPNDIAMYYQQQQLFSQQQAQQTFGPNIIPQALLAQQQQTQMTQNPLIPGAAFQQQPQPPSRNVAFENQLSQQLQQANQQVSQLQNQIQDQDKELQHLQMMLQDQKMQYEQEIKMIHREQNYKYEDYSRLKNDNQFILDKHEQLQQKYQNLKLEFDKQKDFYEKALEQRFNQMEQFEEESMQLRARVEELETRENDNKIKCDMALRDKEDLKRKLEQKDRENINVAKKEEELLGKLEEIQKILKEKEFLAEKKVEENFTLKERINGQKQEIDKLKKKVETLEDQVTHKEFEFKQLQEDFTNFKKKQKFTGGGAEPSNPRAQGSNNHESSQLIDDLKSDLMIERSQNNALRDQIEHLQSENYELRQQLSDYDDLRRECDSLRREIQQVSQVSARAGGAINQRQPVMNNENMYGQQQQVNRGGRGKGMMYDEGSDNGGSQAEISWTSGVQSNRQINHQQQQRKGGQFDRRNDDFVQNVSNKPPPQEVAKKYNLPASFFQDNEFTEDQVLSANRQKRQTQQFDQQQQQKPLGNDRTNISAKQNNYMGGVGNNQAAAQGINSSRGQANAGVALIQTKEDKEREKRMEQVKQVEQNLLSMQLEQKKLQAEFDKIPDNAKTMAQRRRKEELDREIKITNKNISNLKNKLRELDALHR